MSQEKQKRLWHLLFFPGFLILLIVCNLLVDPGKLYHERRVNTRNRNFAGLMGAQVPLDVIVTGDSESYTTVSPLQIWNEHGIPMFNGGMAGQNMVEAYSELSAAFKTQSPQVVLLETNLLFRSQEPISTAEMVLAEQYYRWLPALRFHSTWKTVFFTKKEVAKEKDWPKGFHLVRRVSAPDEGLAPKDTTTNNPVPTGLNLRYLDRIQDLCRRHGAALVLYSAPSAKNYTPERQQCLAEITAARDLPYLNLNDPDTGLEMNWLLDSYDGGDHLNLAGAKRTSTYIGDYLAEQFSLPDRRDDPTYEPWVRAAKKYKKRVKQASALLKKRKIQLEQTLEEEAP